MDKNMNISWPLSNPISREDSYNQNALGAQQNSSSDRLNLLNEKTPAGAGFWKRRWLHVRRHWILYSVGVFLSLAVGLPLLLLVIIPAVAQKIVDGTALPVQSASLTNPTPTTVDYSLNASIKVPVAFDLNALTLNMFTNDSDAENPYARITLPEQKLSGQTTISITNQTTQILNQTQFQSFLANTVNSESFSLNVQGSTDGFLGSLKTPITLNKQIPLKGLNKLTGFAFVTNELILPPESDGTNLRGSVLLPNPSSISVELCNLTLNVAVGALPIGTAMLDNVFLAPGNNTLPIRAILNLQTITANLTAILNGTFSPLDSNGNPFVSSTGNSTVCNGVHIPYYEKALGGLVLSAPLPFKQVLADAAAKANAGAGTGSANKRVVGGGVVGRWLRGEILRLKE